MATSINSIFQAIIGHTNITTHDRYKAAMCIKRYFIEHLDSFSIVIPEEDIEELSYDIVDELCSEERNFLDS